MKILFCFTCLTFLFSNSPIAQVSKVIPQEANDFYNKSMPLLRTALKDIVLKTAKAIENRKINADSLSHALKANKILRQMNSNDAAGIIVLIMVQATKDADADLKNMVLAISHSNDHKENSKDDENESQHLQLQMIMDRKSDMAEEISYVMKKISGTQQNIINNLK